jgi:hypothetical protein
MFSPQEDDELTRLVLAMGDGAWVHVASRMPPGFTPRQCRERWRNYLDPRLGSDPWTEAEDARLVEEFQRLGTRWAMIAEQFPGRSGNTIRNRYLLLQRKRDKDARGSPGARPAPPPAAGRLIAPMVVPQCAPPPPEQQKQPPASQEKPAEAAFSLFSPEHFVDLSQENVMSLFFPNG